MRNLTIRQSGFTLTELVIVMVVISLAAAVSIAATMPYLAREKATSAVHEVKTLMQLARMEAAKRNRACRFQVSGLSGNLEVFDTMGTPTLNDDQRLHHVTMPSGVSLALPTAGEAVSLARIGAASDRRFHAVFAPDGSVQQGPGSVSVHGGDRYQQITLHVAGGVETTRWNGTAWVVPGH